METTWRCDRNRHRYVACLVFFYFTVTTAPDLEPMPTFETFSFCTATGFATAAVLNLLAEGMDGFLRPGGEAVEASRARHAVACSVRVIHLISFGSHLLMALGTLPVHATALGRVAHAARWAEWISLVFMLMVLMHAMEFDIDAAAAGPVLDANARFSIAAQMMSTLTGCVCTLYFRRADLPKTGRGDAAATTWIVRGDETRRRRGHDVDSPRRRVAALRT